MSKHIYDKGSLGYASRKHGGFDATNEAMRAPRGSKKLLAFLWVALCLGVVAVLARALAPWLQSLTPFLDEQFGIAPKVYRDVSRASGLAAYGLLWLSMSFGLLISGRISRSWPGGPEAFEMHRFCSLLALAFTLFHVLVLLGDPRLGGSPVPLLALGALTAKAPWAWLGQLSLYILALVVGSFYIRRWIGKRVWRLIHALTFALYVTALAHSVVATSDSSILALTALYWTTGLGLVVLAACRAWVSIKGKLKRKAPSAHTGRHRVVA